MAGVGPGIGSPVTHLLCGITPAALGIPVPGLHGELRPNPDGNGPQPRLEHFTHAPRGKHGGGITLPVTIETGSESFLGIKRPDHPVTDRDLDLAGGSPRWAGSSQGGTESEQQKDRDRKHLDILPQMGKGPKRIDQAPVAGPAGAVHPLRRRDVMISAPAPSPRRAQVAGSGTVRGLKAMTPWFRAKALL